MYIISKTKDYYDSVAGQKGIDKTIVFERHTDAIDYVTSKRNPRDWWRHTQFPIYGGGSLVGNKSFTLFLVGFCGKMYVGCLIKTCVKDVGRYSNSVTVQSHIYGLDNIEAVVNEYHNNKDHFANHCKTQMDHMKSLMNSPAISELFYKHNTPHFALYSGEQKNLHINASLKDIEFYKVFDPFMAFQEIEMYITGVLGVGNKPTIEVADKYKIVGHGFDYKYSFRKEPEKKR